ncbi:hypothetical protein FOZ60_016135 [Perkinsus olseni]|uniref:Protein kinase domain-containing protein n=1 Tax=Perkinsus olseni TaxID=32597 RepID=A0A7J6P5N2_PEROL|nr:hypothetical protein FOZ60_016135 [Perkinsus olseni]
MKGNCSPQFSVLGQLAFSMATSRTVAASALDFGFLRLVYSHARQLRLKRKEAAGGGVEKGGLRQVILDVAQGVRKASRTRRFLGGGAYDRGARDCSEEKTASARIAARKEGGEFAKSLRHQKELAEVMLPAEPSMRAQNALVNPRQILTTGASPGRVRKPGRSGTKPRSSDEKNYRSAVGEKEGHNADGVESVSRSKGSDRDRTLSGSPRHGENHASDSRQNDAGADRLRNRKQGEEIADGRSKSDAKVGWGRKKSRLTNSGLRCMFLMSDACQRLNATTSVEGLLELHALLKLVEPRVHEFKGLSVAFWRYLKHLLGCCEERLSWGRDADILREVQMYWADHVGWYEGRTKRTRIGRRSAVLERSKVADGDTSAPPAECKEHDEMKGDGLHGGEIDSIEDMIASNVGVETVFQLSRLGGKDFRTQNDRTGFCHGPGFSCLLVMSTSSSSHGGGSRLRSTRGVARAVKRGHDRRRPPKASPLLGMVMVAQQQGGQGQVCFWHPSTLTSSSQYYMAEHHAHQPQSSTPPSPSTETAGPNSTEPRILGIGLSEFAKFAGPSASWNNKRFDFEMDSGPLDLPEAIKVAASSTQTTTTASPCFRCSSVIPVTALELLLVPEAEPWVAGRRRAGGLGAPTLPQALEVTANLYGGRLKASWFNIVLVFDARRVTLRSTTMHFQAVQTISRALVAEENRCGYLSEQVKGLLGRGNGPSCVTQSTRKHSTPSVTASPDSSPLVEPMRRHSSIDAASAAGQDLVATLTKVFTTLSEGPTTSLVVNNSVRVVITGHAEADSLMPAYGGPPLPLEASNCGMDATLDKTLLLVKAKADYPLVSPTTGAQAPSVVPSSDSQYSGPTGPTAPSSAHSQTARLVLDSLTSTKSLADVARALKIPQGTVLRIAKGLVSRGEARVIPVLQKSQILVPNPSAMPLTREDLLDFEVKFNSVEMIPRVMFEFSHGKPLMQVRESCEEIVPAKSFADLATWLLERDQLVHMALYLHYNPPLYVPRGLRSSSAPATAASIAGGPPQSRAGRKTFDATLRGREDVVEPLESDRIRHVIEALWQCNLPGGPDSLDVMFVLSVIQNCVRAHMDIDSIWYMLVREHFMDERKLVLMKELLTDARSDREYPRPLFTIYQAMPRLNRAGAVPAVAWHRVDRQDRDGFRRSLTFWSTALPAFAAYKAVEWYAESSPKSIRPSPDQASLLYESLHEKYSPVVRNATVIKHELGITDLSEIFQLVDPHPVGSASIGQCYRGVLREEYGGHEVAIKVQPENIEEQFRADLSSCRAFCKMALPQLVQPLDEIESQFLTEFDYRLEAENMEEIREKIMPHWGHKVVIPKSHLNLCTKRVLVMEYLRGGTKLLDGLMDFLRQEAARQGRPVEELEREHVERLRRRKNLSHTTAEAYKQTLRKALVRSLDALRAAAYVCSFGTVGHWGLTALPPNTADLLATVMKVHGEQVFTHGTFNGDPHPGNILLMPDGRLGLIDFGQVKRLDPSFREHMARLAIALNEHDDETTMKILFATGYRHKYNDPEIARRLIAFWLDRDTSPDVIPEGMNIHQFLEEMEKRDPAVSISQDAVMVCRSL